MDQYEEQVHKMLQQIEKYYQKYLTQATMADAPPARIMFYNEMINAQKSLGNDGSLIRELLIDKLEEQVSIARDELFDELRDII